MAKRRARLFLGNLPEQSSENDIRQRLKKFGTVNSVEIKQKKEVDSKIIASTFAFVNIEAEESTLQQCLNELRSKNWDGSYIKAELAKESFLERLQRERNEAAKANKFQQKQEYPESPTISAVLPAAKTEYSHRKRKTRFEDESDPSKEDNLVLKLESFSDLWKDDLPARLEQPKKERTAKNSDSYIDLSLKPHHLKEGFSKSRMLNSTHEPTEKSVRSPDTFLTKSQIFNNLDASKDVAAKASEMKRVRALEEKSKALKQQKDAIKLALSSIDVGKPSNKIIFDDDGDPLSTPSENDKKGEKTNSNYYANKKDNVSSGVNGSRQLFDEGDENDDWQGDFRFKKQFEGKKGQKLLEMQARFKDDERFVIDERFAESDDESETADKTPEVGATLEEKELQEEKAKEMEILASVLGEPVQKSVSKKNAFNPMVRFDPLKPSHAKFELPKPKDTKLKSIDIDKTKKVGNLSGDKKAGRIQVEAEPLPVDDKQFYQVATNLKELFKKDEKQVPLGETTSFSLRKMFSSSNEDNETKDEIEVPKVIPTGDKQTRPKTINRPILRGFQGSKPLAMFTKKVLRPELDGMTNTFCQDVDVEAISKKFSEKRRLLGRMLHKKRVVLERQQHFKHKIGAASAAHKALQRESALRRKTSKPWEKRRGKK